MNNDSKWGIGMKEVERAYLAGLFDGEGCASVVYSHYTHMTKNGKKLYPKHAVYLVISNTDPRILKEFLLLIGKGGLYTQKNIHTIRITQASEIIEMIEIIKPYIRVKKHDLRNLENAARFILKLRGSSKKHTWTDEETKKFQEFADQSKALKGGGKRRGRPRIYPLKQ